MTSEQKVRAKYPKATIESQKTNGGKRYYLVRKERGAYSYIGEGSTKSKAWVDAAKSLEGVET